MSNQIADRIHQLRTQMSARSLDGYLVPRTDEFQNESVADYAERLKYISGFTGSAGWAVVLADKAALLTDGRYTLQAAQQVDGKVFDIVDIMQTSLADWLNAQARDGAVIGYDPKLVTIDQLQALKKKSEGAIVFRAEDINLIDENWPDRPVPPLAAAELFPDDIAGRSAGEKIAALQADLKNQSLDAFILTAPDSICWLLNVRGDDIPCTPVILSYAICPAEGPVKWIVNPAKISTAVLDHLKGHVEVVDFDALEDEIQNLAVNSQKIGMDFKAAPVWFKSALKAETLDMKDPCIEPRACKTESEKASIRQAHIQDGLAVCKFLYWLEQQDPTTVNELDVVDKLEQFRREGDDYLGPSFPTIAGFGANGAIIHYRSTKATNKNLEPGNLLLIDSGGQYVGGTTDITRTVAIGMPSEEMKKTYALVLKGHIALAAAQFQAGTTGKQLDEIARKPLLGAGLNYAHGTGHGVGCRLSVHEQAANISPRGEDALQPGMLLSNEPGYYKEGAFGIRIENLVFVEEQGPTLGFETVTMVPIDMRCVHLESLNTQEKQWLKEYHETVFSRLSGLIHDHGLREWLRDKTKLLS